VLTNAAGGYVTYDYEDDGLPRSVVPAPGRGDRFDYDNDGVQIRHTDSIGVVHINGVNPYRRTSDSFIQDKGIFSQTTFDHRALPSGAASSANFDGATGDLKDTTSPLLLKTDFNIDAASGDLLDVKDTLTPPPA